MNLFSDSRDIRNKPNRPRGAVPQKKNLEFLYQKAKQYCQTLQNDENIIGITLSGGLSRGYGDKLSEIDLNIYLSPKIYEEWVKGKGPLPHGDSLDKGQHIDIKYLNFEMELKESWNLIKKWDASYQKILFDPQGKVEELLTQKDVFTGEEKFRLALINYLDCTYFGDIVVRQWILREDYLVAHQMLNKAIPALVRLLFLANEEYPPFEKWLVNYSYSLRWRPPDWKKKLELMTQISSLTKESVNNRKSIIMDLYYQIWAKIVGKENKTIGLLELRALEEINFIRTNTPSLQEFQEKYSIEHLGMAPLYKLVDIKEFNGEDHIIFNEDKFNQAKMNQFKHFLDWNQKILNKLTIKK